MKKRTKKSKLTDHQEGGTNPLVPGEATPPAIAPAFFPAGTPPRKGCPAGLNVCDVPDTVKQCPRKNRPKRKTCGYEC